MKTLLRLLPLARSLSTSTKYELVVGLEIHAQIKSESKLFSSASTKFASPANTQVARLDAGIPGTLPVLNKFCVQQTVRTALALNCEIQEISQFERKHYFYADLPLGYQITQQRRPVAKNGHLTFEVPGETLSKSVKIERIQIEQDSGKSVHDNHPSMSLIDLNRAGQGLMEIVTAPDIRSAAQAAEFLKRLQFLLRHVGSCDGNMDEGLRVSVARFSLTPIRIVFNRNHVESEAEGRRQQAILEAGGKIECETMQFDATEGATKVLRSKHNQWEYRYMPDPDLPLLVLSQSDVADIRSALPPLPDAIVRRLVTDYGLPPRDAQLLLAEPGGVEFFEQVVAGHRDPKVVKNW